MDIPPSRDEIARLATTLNDLLARLEAVIARERSFVSDAGHELRSPLARLKVEIDLALRYPRSHTQLQDALRSASEETDHLVRLAEDLLLLTRADATRHQPSQTRPSVALAPLLTRLADRHQAATGRLMRLDCPLGLAVRADPVRLERAVANLIDNAVQHGRGPIGITATPATTTAGEQIEIHVTDHGPGFPPAFLPHAFERFSRPDEARSGGGTGLGLAIVAAIARSLGGDAHAGNAAGGGAHVWITLPAPLPLASADHEPARQPGF